MVTAKRIVAMRSTAGIYAIAFGLPLLLIPVLERPKLGIVLLVGAITIVLASQSVVYPLALAGVPTVVIGLLGSNPFPPGIVFRFLTAWLLLGIVFELLREQSLAAVHAVAAPLGIAVFWGLLLLLRSVGTPYASTKIQLFLATAPLNLMAATLVARRASYLSRYLVIFLVVALLNGLVLVKQLLGGNAVQVFAARITTSVEDSPIGAGREAAYGVLIGLFFALASASSRQRLLGLLALPALVAALLASGSRGPLLALVISLFVLVACLPWSPQLRRRRMLVGAAALGALALASVVVPTSALDRATGILTGSDAGFNSNGRTEAWKLARDMFFTHPLFGGGTGSFAVRSSVFQYPHNILLEAAAELGIVGLVCAVSIVVIGFVQVARVLNDTSGLTRLEATIVVALFVGALLNSMVSDGIEQSGAVWTSLGLVVGLVARSRGELKEDERAGALLKLTPAEGSTSLGAR